MSTSRFVSVAVDAPVMGAFTYRLPAALEAAAVPGVRVLCAFGNRAVSGVLLGDAEEPQAEAKDVQAILDAEPLVGPALIELAEFIAAYYRAPIGEAIRVALPPGARITANLEVSLTEKGRSAGARPRDEREVLSVLAVADAPLAKKELLRLAHAKPKSLTALLEAGLVSIHAAADRARVRDRTERVATLTAEPTEEQLSSLARSPAKRAILEALTAAGGSATVAALQNENKRASDHLRKLAADGLVELGSRVIRGVAQTGSELGLANAAHQLNQAQTDARDSILAALGGFASFLLHGITGSGKTEVYLTVIAEVLGRGQTAIVLVPEISLTPQLASRFRQRFGDRVAVLHSGLTDRERYDEWHRLKEGRAQIALGARSAIFAPVDNLGIIVVDEEHDSSFKQDEGVRYNGRDVALVRAQKAGAVCVLGSATPSLESAHGAEVGRLTRLSLPARATAGALPTVELVDLRAFQADTETMLTATLATAIEETLAAGNQTILFLNRRGWSTFVLCVSCGDAIRCPNCAVSLTYHRSLAKMLCHYCGHGQPLPRNCLSCGASDSISRRGLGTEQIASAIAERFPAARVARLDRDVAAGAQIEKSLAAFARREVDILVGTQMVTKGHDFPGVTLVGVLCADTGLSLPDFRAGEKTFQLLAQVSGRAGRGESAGRVIIQSYRTDHIAVLAAQKHDFDRFFRAEVESRRELGYPPWGHLVAVRLDGVDGYAVSRRARELAESVRRAAGDAALDILGPTEAPLGKLKGRVRWHFWLRAPDRRVLRAAIGHIDVAGASRAGGVRVSVDVDPISAL